MMIINGYRIREMGGTVADIPRFSQRETNFFLKQNSSTDCVRPERLLVYKGRTSFFFYKKFCINRYNLEDRRYFLYSSIKKKLVMFYVICRLYFIS